MTRCSAIPRRFEDQRSTLHVPRVQLAGLSKAVGLGNEDTFAGPSTCSPSTRWSAGRTSSPWLLLDSRFGYNHFNLEFTQADVEIGEQLGEELGVPNANQQDAQAGIPIFSPTGYTGIGHSRSLPILRQERTFQHVANLTFAADRHVQGGVRRPPPPHGGVPDEPRQRPLQLHLEHHEQPGQQHRRSRDGVVPAGRAEPHRAGLPWSTPRSGPPSGAPIWPTTGAPARS